MIPLKERASDVIFDYIYDKIDSEEWPPGYKLPSESSIALEHGVSRNTVREAFQSLINKGCITRVHGIGSFVRTRHISYGMQELWSIDELIRKNGYTPGSKNVVLETGLPDKKVANYLNIAPYDAVYKVTRVKTADGKPIVYEEGVYPCKILKEVTAADFEGSVFKMLEARHIVVKYANGWVRPIIADRTIAEMLEIQEGIPLLLLETVLFDEDDREVLYVKDYFTDWFEFPIHRMR